MEKSCDKCAFSVLGYPVASVDNPMGVFVVANYISQFLERINDYPECIAFIVGIEVFDIFEQECLGTFDFQNLQDFKKQCALGFVFEAVFVPQGIFLGNPCDAEWLTGEPSQKDIMIGNG